LRRIGLIAISQSSREDITSDLRRMLKLNLEFIECNILDEYSYEEIIERFSPEPGQAVYTTRMKDGREVKVSREKISREVNRCISKLELSGVEFIILLSTTEIPNITSSIPVVHLDKLIRSYASALKTEDLVSIIIPSSEEARYAWIKWHSVFPNLYIEAISPYTASDDEYEELGNRLKKLNPRLIIMDCIEYTLRHRSILSNIIRRPVICPRTILAGLLNELYHYEAVEI